MLQVVEGNGIDDGETRANERRDEFPKWEEYPRHGRWKDEWKVGEAS